MQAVQVAAEFNRFNILKYLITLPEVLLMSIQENQGYHNEENIKDIISKLMLEIDDVSISQTVKYNNNKLLKKFVKIYNTLYTNTISIDNN